MGNLLPMKCAKCVVEEEEEEEEEEEDRLSQLPSCVLSHILSLAFPTMKDAARTSVLSKFWRRRWLFDVDEFDFDIHRWFKLEAACRRIDPLVGDMVKYVEWVSNVLRSHQGATLEIDDDVKTLLIKKLRINMPLTKAFQEDVDDWISYAFSRRVESLEIQLLLSAHHRFFSLPPKSNQSYGFCCFPDKLVESTLDCLRSLSLTGVSVTAEDITSFLRKFNFLECLKVSRSPALENVEVCGSSLALKHLEIHGAVPTLSVTVRDTCLVSLTVIWMNKLVLVNNPKLVLVCAGRWSYEPRDERILTQLSGCFSTLEVLTLGTAYVDDAEAIDEVPQLRELKQLTLIGDPSWNVTLTGLTALLSLSPNLEKLTLEFEKYILWGGKTANYEIEGPRFLLQHLRTVEVHSYCGDEAENGILTFFFKHTLSPIQRVVFNPCNLRCDMLAKPGAFRGERRMSDARAEELRRLIPSSVELIVN